MKINKWHIGKTFIKPFWNQCHFLVQDVGEHSSWGQIIDQKAGIVAVAFFPLDDDWTPTRSAREVITKLPLTDLS